MYKIGKSVDKRMEKLLDGKFDVTEIVEIETTYTVKCKRFSDGYEFYTKFKKDSEGTWVERRGLCSDGWENVDTGESETTTRYDALGDEV